MGKGYVYSAHFQDWRSFTLLSRIFLALGNLRYLLVEDFGSCCDQGQELGKLRPKVTDIARLDLEEVECFGLLGKTSCPVMYKSE